MNIESEAQRRFEVMQEQLKAAGRVDLVPLSDYANESDFRLILGDNAGWEFEDWKAVNERIAQKLIQAGCNVRRVQIDPSGYFEFLKRYHLTNTTQNRAQYVSWKPLADDLKPKPIG